MLLVITSLHTSWKALRPLEAFPAEAASARRGVLSVVDWERQCVVAEAPYDTPAGACFTATHFWLASMRGHNVRRFDRDLASDAMIMHTMFNDLHTLTASGTGVLAAVSGTDAILEMNSDGDVVWTWMATDHGYDHRQDGVTRKVRTTVDWSLLPDATREQTTHLNSALEADDETVLATLFAQGQLIAVDRRSGRSRVLVEGFDRPHRIARAVSCEGWSICDSGASRVVLLEKDFQIAREVAADFNWIQDALWIGDEVWILDANNCRVVEWDLIRHEARATFAYETNRKAFGITIVPPDWESAMRGIAQWGDRYAH